jgi:hypothetical protein
MGWIAVNRRSDVADSFSTTGNDRHPIGVMNIEMSDRSKHCSARQELKRAAPKNSARFKSHFICHPEYRRVLMKSLFQAALDRIHCVKADLHNH